jgi:hypothetical protein
MELLIGLVLEIVAPVVAAMIAALLELVLLVVQGIAGFFLRSPAVPSVDPSDTSLSPSPSPSPIETDIRPRRRSRVRRIAFVATGVLAAASIVALALMQFVFFEATVRWIASIGASRSNVAIEFASARGNLLTGRIELDHARFRSTGGRAAFDLRAERCTLDIAMTSLLIGTRRIELLSVEGVTGDFERLAKPDVIRIRRGIVVERILVERAEIAVRDSTVAGEPFAGTLRLTKVDAGPVRSTLLWFDLLTRSTVDGAFDDAKFSIGGADERHWRITGLPVGIANAYLSTLGFVTRTGTIDLDIVQTPASDTSNRVLSRWTVTLRDAAPKLSELLTKLPLGKRLAEFLEKNKDALGFDFDVPIDEADFGDEPTLRSARFWGGVSTALLQKLGRTAGLTEAQIETLTKSARGLKDWWQGK